MRLLASRIVFSLILTFSISGCSSVSYLLQAGQGQWSLFNHTRPISEVLKDPHTSPHLVKLLSEIPKIKAYGETMGLKATRNYVDYVDLKRPYVVWVVSASPKLKFESKKWWFPVIGSVPYLGWFKEPSAKKFAEELRAQDLDVDLRGASAYSTLGWFRDPVLSSMLTRRHGARGDLVDVILHESVHASIYFSGQTTFNESLASFVAEKLTVKYVEGEDLKLYQEDIQYSKKASTLLHAQYLKLDELYKSTLSDEEKFKRKKGIFDDIKSELGITREIGNATLLQYREYDSGAEVFEKLYSKCDGEFSRFWKKIQTLKKTDFKNDQEEDLIKVMQPFIDSRCD